MTANSKIFRYLIVERFVKPVGCLSEKLSFWSEHATKPQFEPPHNNIVKAYGMIQIKFLENLGVKISFETFKAFNRMRNLTGVNADVSAF